ncbi:unnamed protein product [Mesocestoides corti]|uniref:Uncharacterized protein n=1 Tax=Mesocestoides corti TaxID=53468 RepID=A0A0R3UI24_MESCO|nr:unnamed protein product [Mesocestoides corti]
MEFRALHPSCLFLMLLSEATLCQSKAQQDQRWGIEQDINRLLADDIGLNRDDTNNWLNNTEAANISSSENVTSYWHLPADAPLPEPSTLDSLRSQATTKDFNQIQKSEALLRHCPRLKILPFRPIYEFVACACWCLLFGLLSSAWMVLLCGKRSKTNRSTQGDVYMFKCKLILGLNIHASVCVLTFLVLQIVARGAVSFTEHDGYQHTKLCSIATSVHDLCTSVFWLLVGFSNTTLILFIRGLKPGLNRSETLSLYTRLFKSHRNFVFLSVLTHIIPWVGGIALSTLQLIFLHETVPDSVKMPDRSELLKALTCALPVSFAMITMITRIWKFQGHRLHLPFLSRVTHDYTCQHEQFPMKPSTTAHIASTITEMIPAAVALFTSPVVSGLQLACSAVAAAAIGLWILSIALNENRFLPRAQTAGMLIAISLFYTATLVGYNSRLTLASAITTRNTYIPGEVKRETSGRVCSTSSDAKLSPRELLEIPKFTRTQFFDTLSVSPNEQTDQCCSNRSVQIITVYEPVVD